VSSPRDETQDGGEKMENQKVFDIDKIIAEVAEEFVEDAEEQLDEESVTKPENLEEDDEEVVLNEEEEVLEDDFEEKEDNEEKVDKPAVNDEDEHKRNEAFKRLREERDALAKSDKFLEDLAKQYGLTKDQLIQRFKEDELKKQAQAQNIPEEQLRRMQEMEERLKEVEAAKQREVFNIKAEALAVKHNLNNKQMMQLFEESARLGLDITAKPELLEVAYRAVNYDNAVNEGRQKQLETTKKRSKTSTGSTGTKGREPIVTDEDQWSNEIDSLLKDLNL